MRGLLIVAFVMSQIHTAAAAEVATDAKVLEVNRITLRELGGGATAGFIVNVSETAARALAADRQSTTLQNFQLTTVDERPVQFRVSSRLGAVDVGIDFELTAGVSLKREIKVTVTGQVNVRRRENELDPAMTVFAGESVRHEITTAEGASIVVAGFLTEREAKQLASIETLRDSPMLKFLFSEDKQSVEPVLILTPRVVRAPTMTNVITKVIPPVIRPVPPQGRYTVQVAAYRNRASANALLAEVQKRHPDAFIQETSGAKPMYKVRVGRLANVPEVKQLEKLLRSEGFEPLVLLSR